MNRDRQALVRRMHDSDSPPLLMGILNRTPDSFHDGGQLLDPLRPLDLGPALERAERMVRDGAELLDIGGESTRPGACEVALQEEKQRVLPLIEALAARDLAWLSVDTRSAAIAARAVELGAHMVNDVSAGQTDPAMLPLIARLGVPCVLMHMQGRPWDMQHNPRYEAVLEEVAGHLLRQAALLIAAGLPAERIALDPGIGFGKRLEDNRLLLARFADQMQGTGHPLLLGASRKSFIAAVEDQHAPGSASVPAERLGGSVAVLLEAARQGYRILRVHDIHASAQALRVAAWLQGKEQR